MMKTQQTRNMCVVCRSLIDGTIGNGLFLPLVVEEINRKRAIVKLVKNKSRFLSKNKTYTPNKPRPSECTGWLRRVV